MRDRITFEDCNFCLIDFYAIYRSCECSLVNDLYSYGLLKEDRKVTRDVKLLIMHHVMFQLCEYVLRYKGGEKNVIYFTDHCPEDLDLCRYYDGVTRLFKKIIKQLQKVLPIRVYTDNLMFSEILNCSKGKKREIIARIQSKITSLDFSKFTFSKANLFAKRYNLTFLQKGYFNTLKTKQLLLT